MTIGFHHAAQQQKCLRQSACLCTAQGLIHHNQFSVLLKVAYTAMSEEEALRPCGEVTSQDSWQREQAIQYTLAIIFRLQRPSDWNRI